MSEEEAEKIHRPKYGRVPSFERGFTGTSVKYGPLTNTALGRLLSVAADADYEASPAEVAHLRAEIRQLQEAVDKATENLRQKDVDGAKLKEESQKRQEAVQELQKKQSLQHLINRVTSEAHKPLLDVDSELKSTFEKDELKWAYVMSIDIRRSTELMLKARRPELFAAFITELCTELAGTIIKHFGVFDKFTGDGILAFFPEFFSGEDAGFLAIQAADKCHEIFSRHYADNRTCFMSVLKDCGLGIGIDYGQVKLVQVLDGLTVVGPPVVYACRMGGADAGHTLLNQPAYEAIFHDFSAYCSIKETEIHFKHEGRTVAYAVSCNEKTYAPKEPSWLTKVAEATIENK